MTVTLGFDIGSNSVGSAWIDQQTGEITVGLSVFPAGVDESDEKRGEPKNAKRRMTRRSRITLARRAARKRLLRLKLIEAGLLPPTEEEFKKLLEQTEPWELRRKALTEALTPYEFGRVLLHLSQRRGALGLKIQEIEEEGTTDDQKEDGKVKKAIGEVRAEMRKRNAQTFGEFISMIRAERVTPITTADKRKSNARKGPREFRQAIRNKAGSYEHCADRGMIRDEFLKLWAMQKRLAGPLADLLKDELLTALDNETGNTDWRHRGVLFGQRRQSWDLGTLGRCVLEPTERCAPHADMYASRYLVVETVNNLKIIERGKEPRPITPKERAKIKTFLSGPLGEITSGKFKGQPKRTVSATDLRELFGWGRANKTSHFRFNIEADEDRNINTDWFSREIIHGAITVEKWESMSERIQEGVNRAILKHDPDEEKDAIKLKEGVLRWAGLSDAQADALVAAWRRRPKLDAKRLNMSRKAVRNILVVMDREEPWPDPKRPELMRWLTQIEARKLIAGDTNFKDQTTDKPLADHTRRRYQTGAKGATARDRHYIKKHLLKKDGEVVYGPDGNPLHEPPPAPLISNPVVRKSVHEVRRHLVEYMITFGRKPDEIYIELSREAKMGAVDSDRALFRNRLRNRIRNDIIHEFNLSAASATQQRTAVDRVVLCVQQSGVCPLCGNESVEKKITPRLAASGEGCEVAHIIPKASGGHNGLGNLVLAHTKCNRDMDRRTPRQFWDATVKGGFDEAYRWIDKIYGNVKRPKPSEVKSATADALWSCYFAGGPGRWGLTFDQLKVEQFKKNITDIKDMTARQDAATKYATRQVMSYIADAIFEGEGLPERGGDRRIFATDGMWTSRLRREWGLFLDSHDARVKGLDHDEKHIRQEKNRGDHRHHAFDAIAIALTSPSLQRAWEDREKQADKGGVNTADEEQLENYRRQHPLPMPGPFRDWQSLQGAVRRAVFGSDGQRPVSHRPVKRKMIGALHEETLFGPVIDKLGKLTENYTAKKGILQIDANHLRMPRPEKKEEAIERLTVRKMRETTLDEKAARKWAKGIVASPGYTATTIDPSPGKSGIIRDLGTRKRIRACLKNFEYVKKNKQGEPIGEPKFVDPDSFTDNELKQAVEAGAICHASGVPIRSVVLLRTMSDPVVISRKRQDYVTGKPVPDSDPASRRAYVGGNNHHIEIRVATKKSGAEDWSGEVVTSFEAAQRKLNRLRAIRAAGIPKAADIRKLAPAEREKFNLALQQIELAHPLVDRSDDATKGGKFVMSICEGEMLLMKHKHTGKVGYFVVAKLDKPQSIVVVPHWDARAAGVRKDAEGKPVKDSEREQFAVTPNDLKALAPPGHEHAVKVRVNPLGKVTVLNRD
jgi:CRISPR-associated endonuclease Csn1